MAKADQKRADHKAIKQELERDRQEMKEALNETVEATIRQAWKVNLAAWVGVTVGAFAINLLVLWLVTGG